MVHSVLKRLPSRREKSDPQIRRDGTPSPLLSLILYCLGQIKYVPMVLTNSYGNKFKQTSCSPVSGQRAAALTQDPKSGGEPRRAGDARSPAAARSSEPIRLPRAPVHQGTHSDHVQNGWQHGRPGQLVLRPFSAEKSPWTGKSPSSAVPKRRCGSC